MSRGSPWTVLVLLTTLAILHPTQAATAEEIESLRIAASELGILPGTWNFSTDPCVDGWKGINCCTQNSTQSCCSFTQQSQQSYPVSPCERTSEARVWMLLLRSDIFGQVLNGSLPQSLCNLTSLRVLDVGTHHLKGQVHGCIGDRLSNLESLRLGDNHLNGTIPDELGKLSNLKELYLDVTEISGEIPPALGQLNQLTKLFLRSNFLEGDIPDEIGQLTNLVELDLQVNKLTGSIPTSFVNLTALTTLSLFNNELSGELSASTFQGMSSLSRLNLRRNNFTGRLPALSNSLSMTVMDFGFNQFSGSIPDIGTPGLTDLFLGHNRLNGTIPESFGSLSGLVRLDVSHNMLAGSLQSVAGLGETRGSGPTQMDVAFNFFDVSTAPASLVNQQQVPASEAFFNCNVSSNVNSCSRSLPGERMFFAVNAGGDSVRSSSDNVSLPFDNDTQTVPSSRSVGLFYGGGGAWALELSGDSSGFYAPPETSINMTGAGNSVEELFSSMRWSSTYLAFHGRDLRSGLYVVTLYFAELVFIEPGYRVFDVILQGQVVKKNLDIVGEVGPKAAYRFIHNNVSVNNGSVSVELVHSRSDRFLPPGVWEVQSTGPIVSGISVVLVDYRGEKSSTLSSGHIAGIVIGSAAVLGILLAALVLFCVWFRRKTQEKPCSKFVHSSQGIRTTSQPGSFETSFDVAGTRAMTYQELYEATNGFSEKLGQGGFGAVYKGTLSNGTVVAVKQLLKQNAQVEEDFKKEISIISKVRHRNLLAVIGHSLESDLPMLVCELIPNGSLDRWLFRKRDEPVLSWEVRRKVAVGVSCGLAYLHDESKYRIIHCDVKPANILLDSDFNPRIADFGLARLYDEKESHVTATRLKGTAGYLAPEYAMHLQLSDKVDVYSFGVVLLELLSGRHAVEFSAPSGQVVLVDWAHQEARLPSTMLEIMDPRLQGRYVEQEARDTASVALLCTQRSVSMRPKMQSVWLMLNGTIKVPEYLENLQNAANHSSVSDFDMSPEFFGSTIRGPVDQLTIPTLLNLERPMELQDNSGVE